MFFVVVLYVMVLDRSMGIPLHWSSNRACAANPSGASTWPAARIADLLSSLTEQLNSSRHLCGDWFHLCDLPGLNWLLRSASKGASEEGDSRRVDRILEAYCMPVAIRRTGYPVCGQSETRQFWVRAAQTSSRPRPLP